MDDKKYWSIVASCCLAVFGLAVVSIISSMLSGYQIIGSIAGFLILLLAGHAMFDGNVRRVKIALASVCLLFSLSLFGCVLARTLVEEIPLQLVSFILILFSYETMTLIVEHRRLHMGTNISNNALTMMSWKIVQRRITWLVIVFSGCYVLTISAMYVGFYVRSIVSFLGDASVYLVAATVSLALLVTFREDLGITDNSAT